MTLRAAILPLLLLCFPRTARAQIAVDSQLWLQAVAIVNLTEHWRLHLEEQPRWDDDVTQQFQVLTRYALGRSVTDRVSVWAGHAWIQKMRNGSTAHEQRLWQQMLATLPAVGGWTPTLRVRAEQRWQDGWERSSHRVRLMGRVASPLAASSPWSVALWDEVLVSVNETAGGPPRGLDHNRIFGGVNHRFGPRANLDVGYLHVTWRQRNAPVVNTPGALLTLNLTF
jgi:hypothetical protein